MMDKVAKFFAVWIVLAVLMLLWATLANAIAEAAWWWPWEWGREGRAVSATITMWIAPCLAALFVWNRR
jgi:hypothetical protein